MTIRVALVNDYEVVVHGLAAMMRSYGDRVEVAELAADATVATTVDVALYDTFAQNQGDHAAIIRLLENPSVSKVAVYTWNTAADLERASLRLGAAGYLCKCLSAAELVAAVESLHAGDVVVSDQTSRRALIGGDWPGREEGLTPREAEVLALITQGLTNADIVERTGLSINSIKSYIRTCYRKIEVETRARAVLWGVDHGFQPDRVRVAQPQIPGAGG
jgi:two-component system, NarL family, response regulator LiaR